MKRDLDLVRKILLDIESWPDASRPREVELEGHSRGDINYHASLLHEAKYIDAIVSKTSLGDSILPIHLTWNGHEFLDEARDKTIWEKAKRVTKKAGSTSVSVLRPILVRLGASEAEQVLHHLIG